MHQSTNRAALQSELLEIQDEGEWRIRARHANVICENQDQQNEGIPVRKIK